MCVICLGVSYVEKGYNISFGNMSYVLHILSYVSYVPIVYLTQGGGGGGNLI